MIMEIYESQLAIVGVYKKLAEAEAESSGRITLLDGEEVFKKYLKTS
jgi:hypothetical protein